MSDIPTPRMIVAGRALAGLTQLELATKARITQATLARYEQGKTQLRSNTLNSILGVFREFGIRFVIERDGITSGVLFIAGDATPPR